MIKRFFLGSTEALGEREVGAVINTAQIARDGHIFEPAGALLANYRANPIVLFNHDPSKPVGTTTAIGVSNGNLAARMQFAPAGVSAVADEVCGLVKSGVINGVSIGMEPLECEPLDPRDPRGGQRVTQWELLEWSYVAIPADTGARVVGRSYRGRSSRAAILRSLPSVSPDAIARAVSNLSLDPVCRRLAQIAAEFGEVLTPSRMGTIIDEARRFGQTPEYRLRWLYAARGRVDHDVNDYARRQAELRALTR